MGKLIERHKDLKLTQEEKEYVNRPITTKETELIKNIDKNITDQKNKYYQKLKLLEDNILSGKSNKKIAYLTFDDGPYYTTYKFLDILDKYHVKATFFTIGTGKEKCYDNNEYNCNLLFKEEAKRGHTIANHTYSHAIFKGLYTSPESFINEVKKQEELIKKETGIITNIVRFPGGAKSSGSQKEGIIQKLKENNYGWVDWTAQDGDGGALKSTEQAWSIFTNSINENIEVILMHDYNTITLAILPDIIEYLQKNNYILLPLFYESNMINK